MSFRAIAKELGISHTILVLWRQGKRSLAPEIEARYHSLVTSGYNNGYKQSSSPEGGASHFEPALEDYVGAGRGTRTHTPFKVADFKSAASVIPPSRLIAHHEPRQARETIGFRGRFSPFGRANGGG